MKKQIRYTNIYFHSVVLVVYYHMILYNDLNVLLSVCMIYIIMISMCVGN